VPIQNLIRDEARQVCFCNGDDRIARIRREKIIKFRDKHVPQSGSQCRNLEGDDSDPTTRAASSGHLQHAPEHLESRDARATLRSHHQLVPRGHHHCRCEPSCSGAHVPGGADAGEHRGPSRRAQDPRDHLPVHAANFPAAQG